ncbi:MAG TPA: hypothetical protein VJP81_01290 [Candidatus Dormibacteraeota bacterium]|nr:hypothetical protein [Candidatus Dormibacteraeota bacterium]
MIIPLNDDPLTAPRWFSRLRLADACLYHLAPDPQPGSVKREKT